MTEPTEEHAPVAVVSDERVQKEGSDLDPPNKLHSLPFFLDYTGPALVSQFFRPEQLSDGKTKAVSFRGHLLLGQRVELPDGYVIACAEKQENGGVQ